MRDKLCTASIDMPPPTPRKKTSKHAHGGRTNTIANKISTAISSLVYYTLAYTVAMIVLAFVVVTVAQILSISAPLWIAWLVGVLCAAAVYEAWWEVEGWMEEEED
jgi:hypothetical protein